MGEPSILVIYQPIVKIVTIDTVKTTFFKIDIVTANGYVIIQTIG